MRLVVDANILVAELIRKRGRDLIACPLLELYMAEKAWDEASYELGKRVELMMQKGRFDQDVGQLLLIDAFALVEARVVLVPYEVYAVQEFTAKARIPRDPDDWPTIALALVLEAAIWTSDQDFFGCGLPTWMTDTLLVSLASEQGEAKL